MAIKFKTALAVLSAAGEWHDYTDMVKFRGFGWKRNDVDSDKTTRVVANAQMRRFRLGQKRTLTFELLSTDDTDRLAQMDDDLSQVEFTARVADLHGEREMIFYCTSFAATLAEIFDDGTAEWESGTFDLVEC